MSFARPGHEKLRTSSKNQRKKCALTEDIKNATQMTSKQVFFLQEFHKYSA